MTQPKRPRRAEARPTTSVQSLVKDLVDQFDQPLDFYRELIQNAIDAGSNRIDVTLEHFPGPDGGKALIQVEDDGEGMDEDTIQNYLLVLFKSTKEDDLTKIGKFGIGFVSVFAPEPEMVRVFTAKNGLSFRLDFPSYKRYELYRVPEMREGSLVELQKAMTREKYDQLVADSLKTIRYWCKHAETRIVFHDKSSSRPAVLEVSEKFDLPGGSCRTYEEEGTIAVLGYAAENPPFCGYYNRGLTLKEDRKAHFPGIEFKIKSRYLEHTLTRDNVLEDENYRKAMDIVRRLVDDELPKQLKGELEKLAADISARAAAGHPPEEPVSRDWARRLPYLRALLAASIARWRRSDWAIFPSVSGKALTLPEVRKGLSKTGGALHHEPQADRLTRELGKLGIPVLVSGPWDQELAALTGAKGLHRASREYIFPELAPEETLPSALRAFLETARGIDASSGAKYRRIWPSDFKRSQGAALEDKIFVVQKEPGALVLAGEKPSTLLSLGRPRFHALVNLSHPFIDDLTRLHATRPGLAAFLLLKTMHLHDGDVPPEKESEYSNLSEKVEGRLLQAALRVDAGRPRIGA